MIALLAWYDESPHWLAATVASTARFCDHVVAVDGAYRLVPSGAASSGVEQSAAIRDAAEAVGIGCTVHVPDAPWPGNEVEKRTFMFRAGSLIADPGDWFFVIDADEVVVNHPRDLRARLEAADELAAEATLRTATDYAGKPIPPQMLPALDPVGRDARRAFFRVIDDMRVHGNHYTYLGEHEGQTVTLWRQAGKHVPALAVPDVIVEHRHHLRPARRTQQAQAYYAIRDAMGVESRPVMETA